MKPIIGSTSSNSNTFAHIAFQAPLKASSAHAMQRSCMQREAPLGTYTKSSPSLPTSESPETPQSLALRVDRYLLQNVARALFLHEYHTAQGEDGIPNREYGDDKIPMDDYNKLHKIVKCSRTRVRRSVTVHKSSKGGAFYSGLSVCSNVWACTVCSAKIQERRRLEVAAGMDYAYEKMGKQCTMITLTFPHTSLDTCEDLREKQSLALKDFRKSGNWSKKMKSYGFEGLIRSLEVTYGQNGWHPHTHELWIMDYFNTDQEIEFKKYILGQWEKACKKQGLIPRGKLKAFRQHAVDFKFSASNSDYLAKADDSKNLHWGVDREIAKASSKVSDKAFAPKKGIHVFQLLAAFSKGQLWAGGKYLEFVKAMKGARQLFWSPNLKKKMGIDDLSDKEIAEKKEEEAIELTDLDMFAWEKVLELKARAEVLNVAETEGLTGLIEWFRNHKIDLFRDTRPPDFRRDDIELIPKATHVGVDKICLDFIAEGG